MLGGTVAAAIGGPIAAARIASPDLLAPIWGPPKPVTPPSEVHGWETGVGAKVTIFGEAGTATAVVAAVEHGAFDPLRPPELARQLPFTLYFETDARTAPVGQKMYRVMHPTRGALSMFLGRGADRGGVGVLYAIFN